MSCPTCDHTMQALVTGIFWCPRCGTISGQDRGETPKLVLRCRQFDLLLRKSAVAPTIEFLRDRWHIYGVQESINPPADRPALASPAPASRGGDEEAGAAAAWDESNEQDRFDGGRLS